MAKGDVVIKTVTVAGTSGSYVATDVIGTETSIANAVNSAGGSGRIYHARVTDDSDVMGACDLMFASATATAAADSATFAPSDPINKLYKSTIELPGFIDVGGARRVEWDGVKGIYCAVTTLFMIVVARSTIGTLAANALEVELWIMQDQ